MLHSIFQMIKSQQLSLRNDAARKLLIGMGQTLFSSRLFPEAAVCFEHAIPKVCCYLR
jgi:hypothetical protein